MDVPRPAANDPDAILLKLLRARGHRNIAFEGGFQENVDDIPALVQAGKDVRLLVARAYVREYLDLLPVASLCSVAGALMWMAPRWRTLEMIMDTDDSVWGELFEADFEQFGEQAHEWTQNLPMPWKSAYLWTVFFRRRCLWHMAVFWQGDASGLRSISFGRPGSVCAVEHWINGGTPAQYLSGYYGADERVSVYFGITYPPPDNPSAEEIDAFLSGHGRRGNRDLASFPCDAVMAHVSRMHARDYAANARVPARPLRTVFRAALVPRTGSLTTEISWNYADALYAYCLFGKRRGVVNEALTEEERAIFIGLPDYPTVRGRVFLGTQMQ